MVNMEHVIIIIMLSCVLEVQVVMRANEISTIGRMKGMYIQCVFSSQQRQQKPYMCKETVCGTYIDTLCTLQKSGI